MNLPIVAIEVVKENNFVIEETDDEVIITGTVFSIPASISEAWSSKNLTIRAYELTLSGSLSLPGKRIVISTRALTTTEELTISVSGKKQENWTSAAPDGRAPGDCGGKGEPGRNGESAGSIIISAHEIKGFSIRLEANGSDGRQGQQGGNGAQGKNGIDANTPSVKGNAPPQTGGRGGRGGNAGAGGDGGKGGNGGTINVFCLQPSIPEMASVSVFGGEPGKPGENGRKGIGGTGGSGAHGLVCWSDTDPRFL